MMEEFMLENILKQKTPEKGDYFGADCRTAN